MSDIILWRRPYLIPRPTVGEAEFNRFHHLDVSAMSDGQLWAEHEDARAALAAVVRSGDDPVIVFDAGWTVSASAWLRERVARTRSRLR